MVEFYYVLGMIEDHVFSNLPPYLIYLPKVAKNGRKVPKSSQNDQNTP